MAVVQDGTQVVSQSPVRDRLVRKHCLVSIAVITALFYLVYLLYAFNSGHDPRSFILIQRQMVLASHASKVIKVEPGFPYVGKGREYDGANYYVMALDPVNARYYVTGGSYYYSRVLYPLAARLLALGQPGLIPYTLILINLISVVWGTVMLAAWLRRKRVPPWFALIYAADSGVFVAFQRDLTEPLAYALLATGIYILQFGGKRRVIWSGVCFALAVLTRDKAAILALVAILGFFLGHDLHLRNFRLPQIRHQLPGTIALAAMTLLPYTALKVFLYLWLHSVTIAPAQQVAPFAAMFSARVSGQILLSDVLGAMVPAATCAVLALWSFLRGSRDLSLAALFLLVIVTTVTLNPEYFIDVTGLMRATILVVMATLYALPALDTVTHGNRMWLYLCAIGWVSMTPSLYITFALYPWIQLLAVLVVLVDVILLVLARGGLRILRPRLEAFRG